MKKAVIFDLDGTILDTLDSIWKCGNMMLAELGFAPAPREQYGYFAGNGADKLVERALRYSGDDSLAHFDEGKRIYRLYFRQYCDYNVCPYDGMLSLLDELCGKGIRLAVCTNKPHEEAVRLVKKHFGDRFSSVLGQRDDFPRKPDPKGIHVILNEWGMKADECIYIGDSDVDMFTGKAAGVFTIGALWGFRTREELASAGADALAEHPKEILLHLK